MADNLGEGDAKLGVGLDQLMQQISAIYNNESDTMTVEALELTARGGICAYFCRATRMHSTDYAVARCPSVRLSHAVIEYKRLDISSKFFSPSGSAPF